MKVGFMTRRETQFPTEISVLPQSLIQAIYLHKPARHHVVSFLPTMSGHHSEPLPSREVERYASSALHVYHRGQSHREYEFKAEDIRLLFPNYRM